MEKEIIKNIILEQNKILFSNLINRNKLQILKEKEKSPFIIIITGIRRCGKSTLLDLFRKTQQQKDYKLNFDDERLINFTVEDFDKLYDIFIELFGKQTTFYFDEIQNIIGWERFVRRISDSGNKVYITGSNASMLSKELGTHLTGRYIGLELYPFSFEEYLDFKKIKIDKNQDFNLKEKNILIKKEFLQYLKKGGFPLYLQTNDSQYFKYLYESILYRDIITRYKIKNEQNIKDLLYYLVSNIGKEFSYNSLKKVSNILNTTTIKDYISYFENTYLMFTIQRYDFSLKKQLISEKKVYFIDTGFAEHISFEFSENLGRKLENSVFLELKRNNKEIFYHKNQTNRKECDFLILEKQKITQAIQVTKSLENEKTRQREIEGLIDACKKYKLKQGTILTLEETSQVKIDNIEINILPITRWILENTN